MKLFVRVIILVIVFVAGLLVGLTLIKRPAIAPTTGEEIGDGLTVELMLDYGNGEIQTFNNIELNPGQTVFDLLAKITQEHKLEFSYKDYGGDMGKFIESINNIKNDYGQNLYWHYWVNNYFAQVGASNYQLSDNDVVLWKYIKSQY